MRILAVGDVCGPIGCETVYKLLPSLKRNKKIDFVIINGENSAEGNGITPLSADTLFNYGADVITGGNHSLRRKEILEYKEQKPYLLHPDNLPDNSGEGYCLVDMGYTSIAVINLSGKIYLDSLNASCPLKAADELIEKAKSDNAKIIIVDFHAEATSEKRAMGIYLDGRVSVVYGTHTHIQTADEAVLKNGTGYITDIGMTGPIDSILGVESEIIINRLKDNNMAKFKLANGECMLNGCIFQVDNKTGKAISVERINIV